MSKRGSLTPIDCSGWACTGIVVALLVSIAAIIFAAVAANSAAHNSGVYIYTKSGELNITPDGHHLNGNGAALAMTLPNDLSDRIGITYDVYALDAQPHTITITTGALFSTWDGIHKVVTFGGAIGDGITFRVVAKDLITVQYVHNIAFS